MGDKSYKDRDWLKQKYIVERLTIKDIATLKKMSCTAINYWLKKYDISVRSNSESHKGLAPWNKGLHPKRQPHSEETKRKIGLANKGRKLTAEHKKILIEANKGRIPWNKGKTGMYSEETLIRMSMAGKKNSARYWLGKKRSKKTKDKISKTKNLNMTDEYIKKCLTRRIPTSLEEKFQGIVDKNNLPYKYVGNGSFIIGGYNPDFININGKKIAIEVYARYYKLRNNKSIDKWKTKRNARFKEYGWDIFYFDETEVNEKNVLSSLGGI